jgi:hypothetical protein
MRYREGTGAEDYQIARSLHMSINAVKSWAVMPAEVGNGVIPVHL